MTNGIGVSVNGTDSAHDIFDITIIGAGPTGLFAAFYAGMRGARTQVIDSLEEPGGALTAIYPEKYIYDVAGFPKVLAKDFVEQMVIQAMRDEPDMRLKEEVLGLELLPDGILKLATSQRRPLQQDCDRLRWRRRIRAQTVGPSRRCRARRQWRSLLRQAGRGFPRQRCCDCRRWRFRGRLGRHARADREARDSSSIALSSAPMKRP